MPVSGLPVPVTGAGRDGLAALLADPAHALVALDYDGTLAPVVDRPQDAVPAPGALAALERLAPRLGLALVTGRPVEAVLELGGLRALPGLHVLGQYGVQHWHDGTLDEQEPAPGLQPARAALPDLLVAGANLEDKGLSLVVHTRRSADPAGVLELLHARLAGPARSWGLELHRGRLVLELRPAGFDKGSALRRLLPGRSAVLFAGDDVGDLPAYDEVVRARAGDQPGLLVCSDSEEGPAELRERADLVVDGPAGVAALLAQLADTLQA